MPAAGPWWKAAWHISGTCVVIVHRHCKGTVSRKQWRIAATGDGTVQDTPVKGPRRKLLRQGSSCCSAPRRNTRDRASCPPPPPFLTCLRVPWLPASPPARLSTSSSEAGSCGCRMAGALRPRGDAEASEAEREIIPPWANASASRATDAAARWQRASGRRTRRVAGLPGCEGGEAGGGGERRAALRTAGERRRQSHRRSWMEQRTRVTRGLLRRCRRGRRLGRCSARP